MAQCFGSDYVLGKAKPSDEERWNLLERVYADYEEMNAQQQEIAARKRELDMEFYDGNIEKIEEALHFNENRRGSREGDWDTYEKVEHIVKKFVYCRAGRVFKASEVQEVLEERIRLLGDIEASQKQRITALETTLSSVQSELAEATRLLCMSEARAKALKAECVANTMKARQLQRVCDGLRGSGKKDESEVFRDMRLLIEANRQMEKDCQKLRVALNMGPVSAKKQKTVKAAQRVRARPVVAHSMSNSRNGSMVETLLTHTEKVGELKSEETLEANIESKADVVTDASQKQTKTLPQLTALTGDAEKSVSAAQSAVRADDGAPASVENSLVVCGGNGLCEVSLEGKHGEETLKFMSQPNITGSFPDLDQSQRDVSVSRTMSSKAIYKLERIQERASTLVEQVPLSDALMRAFIKCEKLQELMEWEVGRSMAMLDYDANVSHKHVSFHSACVGASKKFSQDASCGEERDMSMVFSGREVAGMPGESLNTSNSHLSPAAGASRTAVLQGSGVSPMSTLIGNQTSFFTTTQDATRTLTSLSGDLGHPLHSLMGQVLPNGLLTASQNSGYTEMSSAAARELAETGGGNVDFNDPGMPIQGMETSYKNGLLPHQAAVVLSTRKNLAVEDVGGLSTRIRTAALSGSDVSGASEGGWNQVGSREGSECSQLVYSSEDGDSDSETHHLGRWVDSPSQLSDEAPFEGVGVENANTRAKKYSARGSDRSNISFAGSRRSAHRSAASRLTSAATKGRTRNSTVSLATEQRLSARTKRRAARGGVKVNSAFRALSKEVSTLRDACHNMINEMNEMFDVMGKCVDALEKHSGTGQQVAATRTKQALSAVVKEVVKGVAEQEVLDRLGKQGIVLERHPESPNLTDEQWMQNRLYDAIMKSTSEHVDRALVQKGERPSKSLCGSRRSSLSALDQKQEGQERQRERERQRWQKQEEQCQGQDRLWKQGREQWQREGRGGGGGGQWWEREEHMHASEPENVQRRLADLGKRRTPRQSGTNQGDSHFFSYPFRGDNELEDGSYTLWPSDPTPPTGVDTGVWEESLEAMRREMWRLAGHPCVDSGDGNTEQNPRPLHAHMSKGGGGGGRERFSSWTVAGDAMFCAPLAEEGDRKYQPPVPYKTGPGFLVPRLRLGCARLGATHGAVRSNSCEEILEYLRRLQPPEYSRDLACLTPRVFRYDFGSTVSDARRNVREGVSQVKHHLQSALFNQGFSSEILPYATAARRLQHGGALPTWMREAVVMLRREEKDRNQKMAKLIFQKVATNIRTRSILKRVCRGSAFAAYLVVMWEKWMGGWEKRCEALRHTQKESLGRVMDMVVNGFNVVPQQLRGPLETQESPWVDARRTLKGASSYHFRDARIPSKDK
ncbi:hypothetical protein, conserved [Trypanosoma brucei gambiense DAL972]|uniref:Uncharacterized protein n=1 Tax=Trypanosoma brucei gambiense (strain MHOM/CI/86/DAL972) TaxID=679716 RepID=C9ZXH2_TRYB9|nr:hypothetical protein, conserved [Trypanosoma brucei gambiense DAL972]CBH14116.1 hypothetical protein, conserved [Trypanosoma brucei gambiense DAL972]|eukprot:XP_011776387.1 hypothetical protein, conserved [Trypanosoma brucei gambiense DAL972]